MEQRELAAVFSAMAEAVISPIPAALQNSCKPNGHAFMQSFQLQS